MYQMCIESMLVSMICYKSSTSKATPNTSQHPTALNGHLQAAFQLRHSASCAGCAQPGRPGPAQLDARLEACSAPGGRRLGED